MLFVQKGEGAEMALKNAVSVIKSVVDESEALGPVPLNKLLLPNDSTRLLEAIEHQQVVANAVASLHGCASETYKLKVSRESPSIFSS